MSENQTNKVVERILKEIDKSTLLGAAYDCLSDSAKDKFKNTLERILKEETLA